MAKAADRTYDEYSFNIGDMTVSFFTKKEVNIETVSSTTPEHKHELCELYFMSKGQMELISEGERYAIKENDVVLIPVKTRHKSVLTDNAYRTILSFVCTQNKNRSAEKCYDRFKLLMEGGVRIFENFPAADTFRHFARYYYGDYKEKYHLMLSCLYEIIVLLKELDEQKLPVDDREMSDNDLRRNWVIDEYLNSRYADGNLTELASLLHLSRQQTYRVINKLCGKSFGECINEVKMQRAVMLMENADLSLTEISLRVGYKNPNSFYIAFKKHYGVTPRIYRDKLKK